MAKRRGYESVRMDELETDAETVSPIRKQVQNRPAHRKRLLLHRPPVAPNAPPALPKAEARPGSPAVAIPKPPEPPKLLAPTQPPKVGPAPAPPAVVIPKPLEAAKQVAPPEPAQN